MLNTNRGKVPVGCIAQHWNTHICLMLGKREMLLKSNTVRSVDHLLHFSTYTHMLLENNHTHKRSLCGWRYNCPTLLAAAGERLLKPRRGRESRDRIVSGRDGGGLHRSDPVFPSRAFLFALRTATISVIAAQRCHIVRRTNPVKQCGWS
jgi:hypothetical protein